LAIDIEGDYDGLRKGDFACIDEWSDDIA
jgi:hypothetical protein